MKIAQIVCSFPPYKGGIGNSAKRLEELLQGEIEIDTFTTLKDKQSKTTNKVYYLKPLIQIGQAAILPGLLFKLRKYDAIILHYPFFGTNEIIYLYRLFNKKQKLYLYYHMDVEALNPIYSLLSLPGKWCGRKLLKQADKVIGSSLDYLKNSQIKDLYYQNPDKYTDISFHIDQDYYYQNFKVMDKSKIQLIFVGGLDRAHYFKGVEILILALSNLNNKNWTLNIVGNGNLLPKYKQLSSELNLDKNIKFLDNLSDQELEKEYEKSDIIILPSLNQNEAFGIVLIEAMSKSTAVIASDLKGVRQVFNENCGLKIKPRDINDLKNKIEKLISNPELIEKFKQEAYLLSKKRYHNNVIKNKWLNLLSK